MTIFIPQSVLIYLILVFATYTLYELLKDKIPNKWKYNILHRSFLILIATLLGGFFVSDNNLKQALFTFSSVYLGFWLNEQVKFQEERRKLKFFLGMLWQELRYNRTMLETLKENYRFYLDDERDLEIMYLRFSSITTQAGFLKSTVYDAFVASSVITGLKNDDIFNNLATAYTNMRYLQSALGIVLSDFEIKLKVHQYAITQNGKDEYVDQILGDIGKKIKDNSGKELAIAYRSIAKSVNSVDTYLNSLSVKSDEDQMSDNELTKEDRDFISRILRKSPVKLPKDIFSYKEDENE